MAHLVGRCAYFFTSFTGRAPTLTKGVTSNFYKYILQLYNSNIHAIIRIAVLVVAYKLL